MAKTPHFFKIILDNTLQQGKLGIPKKFVRRFGNYLSEKALLKVPGGVKWQVELVRSGDAIWFGNGLQRFVDYYSVSYRTFLVFGFEDFKNCIFSVVIFDKTASEINYPVHVREDNCEEPLLAEQVHRPIKQENVGVDVLPTRSSQDKSPLPSSRPCKKRKQDNCEEPRLVEQVHKLINHENVGVDVLPTPLSEDKSPVPSSRPCKKRKQENRTTQSEAKRGNENKRTKPRTAEKEVNSAFNRASTSYKSDNPMFFIVVQRSYIEKRFRVRIPEAFANKYYKENKGIITLNSVDGETWSVGYTSYTINQTDLKRRLIMITSGWRRFANENNLAVGDVCVFELINQNALKLKVSIFREDHDVAKSISSIGNSKHQQNKGIPCLKEYTGEDHPYFKFKESEA